MSVVDDGVNAEILELRMGCEQAQEDAAKLADSLRALARLLRGGYTVTTGTGGNSTAASASAQREPGENES